jgi:hypothetical protein
MEPILVADSAPLHWLCRFVPKYRPYLSGRLREVFLRILRVLPLASELLITGEDVPFRIANLLVSRDTYLGSEPAILLQEYVAPYMHAHVFAVCSLSLSEESDDEIATALAHPIFDLCRIWPNRDKACQMLAKLAARLYIDIGFRYFEILLEHPECAVSVSTGHLFVLNLGTTLLKRIAANAAALIRNDSRRLEFYFRLMTPGFQKLDGAPEEAVQMLLGIMGCVSPDTPQRAQERVIDVVGMVYWNLRLTHAKDRLLEGAQAIMPELALLLAFSFEPVPSEESLPSS